MNNPLDLMRHVKVLEAQVERDADLDHRFEGLATRLELRVDEAPEELEAGLGLLEQRIDDGFEEIEARLSQMIASIGELTMTMKTVVHALARLTKTGLVD
jgi:hypothetical protein